MMRIKSSKSDAPNPPGDDWLWGVENIAREINRKKHQVYPLLPQLMEAGVVKRYKSYAASRSGLRKLIPAAD